MLLRALSFSGESLANSGHVCLPSLREREKQKPVLHGRFMSTVTVDSKYWLDNIKTIRD